MKIAIKQILPFVVALAVLTIGVVAFLGGRVSANPSSFSQSAKSAVATTSPTYLIPGISTSTVVYDAYGINGTNQTNNGNSSAFAADKLNVLVQFAGSSTASVLNLSVEYSDDGIDWYTDSAPLTNGYATTTLPVSLTPAPTYSWVFASSTIGGVASLASAATSTRLVTLNAPTRYLRVISSLGTGTGTRGAVWLQLLPKKEVANR